MSLRRSPIVGAAVVATLGASAAVPAAAQAALPHKLRADYLKTYKTVQRLGGSPGRNIVRHGATDKRAARAAEVRRSLGVLKRMEQGLRASRGGAVATTVHAAKSTGGGGGGGLPACTWAPESGGNYGAVGPGGAGGKYQIMPGTWKAYGGSGASAASASPAEQDAVAARIYANQGPSAWTNC